MVTLEIFQILIFLIPGLLASVILNALVVRKQARNELRIVIEALILSLVVYGIYGLFGKQIPVQVQQIDGGGAFTFDGEGLLLLAGVSIAIALILALFLTHDWHMAVARRLHITRRTSRSSVWFDVFYDFDRYVVVNFADGRRLAGWPMYYSDDPSDPYIFIHDPKWIVEEGYVETDAEGILVTPRYDVEFIEFLPITEE